MQTTTPDGTTIAYEVAGTGSPLVLIHGITESRHSWDPLVDDLAQDHTVVSLDLRGHGESGLGPSYDPAALASDVAAVIESAGLSAPLVVGHSLGGMAATAFAAAEECRGVINVDQSVALGDFQAVVQGAEPMLRSDAFGEVFTSMFEGMKGPLPAAESARIAALRRPIAEVVLGAWEPLLELPLSELESVVADITDRVDVPYLALHGIDPGPDYPQWLGAAIPGATVEIWADHGHYPHLVDPARFLATVRAFESRM